MGEAKQIHVAPLAAADANRIVRKLHYSRSVVNNSQLHLGVWLNGKCGGAMQFGPSLDKRKMQGLVRGTAWNGFLELNRMAFADWLPRNSESRALGFAMRWIRSRYPHVEWIVSFADGTQCGDGTIYRAAGFVLTGIKVNTDLVRLKDGTVTHSFNLKASIPGGTYHHLVRAGESFKATCRRIGAEPLQGFQLRYVAFLNAAARERLTVPVLPFSEIERVGAGMYRGQKRVGGADSGPLAVQAGGGGANPTPTLHSEQEQQ